MTPEEFTKGLPKFALNQLGVTPPLVFRGVSARFFPLRASLDVLQQLCDNYLNMVPPEAGRFRVPMPYVYLVVLDYGQMGESEMRTGWFSQVEVYFGVPVEWYKRVRGQWVFYDWGVITPYIFVNDDVSVPVGRTVYGFPKVLAKVELTSSQWMKNPIAPTTLARISTTVFPKAYTGGTLESRVFLEIEKGTLSNMRVPVDTTTPMAPWTIASNLASAFGGFGRDAMWMSQAMRISPVNPFAGPGLIPEMLKRMMPSFAPAGTGFILNSLNVKQFRRAEDPSQICYRALTNGRMQTTGFNRAGLLGETQTMLGDLSGGHTIRLYEHSSLPIAQTMGLEVHRTVNAEGVQVAEFKPVAPFWVDVDLKFSSGANVAWQTDNGIWKGPDGEPYPGEHRPNPPYNNTISTTVEAIAGPFQFTGTTIRVIPLLASKAKLEKALDALVNNPLTGPIVKADGSPGKYKVRFQLWARGEQAINTGTPIGGDFAYVYLTATSIGGVISASDNVGDWAKYELAFMIPVKWQRMKIEESEREESGVPVDEGGNWETVGVGMVPAYTLADNCITAMSRLEIQGIATGTANFVRPESVWLGEEDQANPQQTLLRVDVELLPALGAGQMATFLPVIEITRNAPDYGLGDAPDTAWRWAEDLRHELGMKKATKQQYFEQLKVARALSLELLGNQTAFSVYTLKEFRDATDPNKACYQSLVRVPRVLREVQDLREIEETLAVRIYGYPDMNIVEELGLQAARLDECAAGIVYSMQGLRPFYIRATLDEPLASRLLWRAGSCQWTMMSETFETMLSGDEAESANAKGDKKTETPQTSNASTLKTESEVNSQKKVPAITVDMKAETLQDQMDPSRTSATMFQARQRWDGQQVLPWDVISVEQARDAVSVIDPQTVIESILSREWSNFDPDARWRKGRHALSKGLSALPQGGVLKAFAEAELYRQINNLLAAVPGAVAARIPLAAMVPPTRETLNAYGTTLGEGFQDVDAYVLLAVRTGLLSGKIDEVASDARNMKYCPWLDELMGMEVKDAVAKVDEQLYNIVAQNLEGQGAADRWCTQVGDTLRSQFTFTLEKLKLEQCIDMLSPLAILGLEGVKAAYAMLNQPAGSSNPNQPPTAADFVAEGQALVASLGNIAQMGVVGEPSPHNNLDTVAGAGETRLKEMLAALHAEFTDELREGVQPEAMLDKARAHSTEEGQMVSLARDKCQVQFEALINKLSRAYQRPDFCLRRDAFSAADRDRLLPLALSWDPDWYYGQAIELSPGLIDSVLSQLGVADETQSRPAESGQEGGS